MRTREEVIELLKSYHNRVIEIQHLIGETKRLRGDEAERAQELLKDLKEDVKNESTRLSKREKSLDEHKFLDRLLLDALGKFPRNQAPGSGWLSDLYELKTLFSWRIQEMMRE